MSVDKIVRNFKNFIEVSYHSIKKHFKESNNDFENHLAEFLQANWEILVEELLCKPQEFLEVYGDGADYYEQSSRISTPDAKATHYVFCRAKHGKEIKDCFSNEIIKVENLVFNKFVSWDGRKYDECPKFSFILLENECNEFLVNVEEVIFDIAKF